jgi:hypothetical protein
VHPSSIDVTLSRVRVTSSAIGISAPSRPGPGRPAGIGQQHRRQQPGSPRRRRGAAGGSSGPADRLGRQLDPVQARPPRC